MKDLSLEYFEVVMNSEWAVTEGVIAQGDLEKGNWILEFLLA